MIDLSPDEFPTGQNGLEARWRPIQIEPVPGSGERITVGVAVAGDGGYVVELAPGIDKLDCLYGREARAIIDAATLSVASLDQHLRDHGPDAWNSFEAPFISVDFGEERVASGSSLEGIAHQAFTLSSSLMVSQRQQIAEIPSTAIAKLVEDHSPVATETKLTKSVREIVTRERPRLEEAFNVPLKTGHNRRAPVVHFLTHRTVANFNLMRPGRVPQSLRSIRNSLWTLLIHRDMDEFSSQADHRVYIQRPKENDPHWSEVQLSDVADACEEAHVEAGHQELEVRVVTSVEEIGADVLEAVA